MNVIPEITTIIWVDNFSCSDSFSSNFFFPHYATICRHGVRVVFSSNKYMCAYESWMRERRTVEKNKHNNFRDSYRHHHTYIWRINKSDEGDECWGLFRYRNKVKKSPSIAQRLIERRRIGLQYKHAHLFFYTTFTAHDCCLHFMCQ